MNRTAPKRSDDATAALAAMSGQTSTEAPDSESPRILALDPSEQPPRCRVLVVDDNVDSARSMAMLLQLEGYEVECAFDGEEALARAESHQPHAVILDLGLPLLNGYEVARRLRETPALSRIGPLLLIALSGYGRERDRARAAEAGFDLHLTKPADPNEVLQVLARHRDRSV